MTASQPPGSRPLDPADAPSCALARCIRFEVAHDQVATANPNTWSASPIVEGLGAYFEVDLHVEGSLGTHTGMTANIHDLDTLGRGRFVPLVAQAMRPGGPSPAQVMRTFFTSLDADDPAVTRVVWHLNPRLHLTMRHDAMDEILIAHRYQFAASHRLHSPHLTEAENLELFGKCCWLNGHGHNYHVQVEVAAPVDGSFSRQWLDELVDEHVVERFDHKYLNLDCDEFAHRTPTVENITIVCHDLLVDPIASAGARLHQVKVWETEKTWSAYPMVPGT